MPRGDHVENIGKMVKRPLACHPAMGAPLARAGLASALAVYCIAIFVFSSSSSPPGSSSLSIPGMDKLAHFGEYFILGALAFLVLISFSLDRSGFPADWFIRRGIELSFLFGALYGFTDELHQYFVPGRTMDPLDWLVDACGSGAGVLASFFFISIVIGKRNRAGGDIEKN